MTNISKTTLAIALTIFLASCASNGQKKFYGTKLASTGLCQEPSVVTDMTEAIPCMIKPPKFPRNAIVNGIQGGVTFMLTVSKEGKPADIKIVESVPAGVFDAAAMTAINHWVFKPKMVEGSAVKQENMRYTMEFKIN